MGKFSIIILVCLLFSCTQHEDESKINASLIIVDHSGGLIDIGDGRHYAFYWITMRNDNVETIWNADVYCGFLRGQDTVGAKRIWFGGMGAGIEWTEKYLNILNDPNGLDFRIFDVDYTEKR